MFETLMVIGELLLATLGSTLMIAIPMFIVFWSGVTVWLYILHRKGTLRPYKNILTSSKTQQLIVWSDDFREACELFLEHPDDPRVQRVLYKTIMRSMFMLSDDVLGQHKLSRITGIESEILREQLKVNLNNQYYVNCWGEMPIPVESNPS